MGPSYTWHPGTGRVAGRWPIPVALAPDELFSTWLIRTALAQGADPLSLTSSLWPQWRPLTLDLDRGIDDERLQKLAVASGVSVAALNAASLLPIVRASGLEPAARAGIWYWVLALGSRNRRRRGGLQYCPVCLDTDHEPYFRLQWRLAWHTACIVHQLMLFDRCSCCHAPVEPHRLVAGMSITSCSTCRGDFRRAKPVVANINAMRFQQSADTAAWSQKGHYGQHLLTAKAWFDLARYKLMLLRCAGRFESSRLRASLVAVDASVQSLRRPETGLSFEILPTYERAHLASIVGVLLDAGPEKLCAAALAQSATLRHDWPTLPPVLGQFASEAFGPKQLRFTAPKARANAPVAQRTVLIRWARFRRRTRQAP